MIVDSSAIIAIAIDEPAADWVESALLRPNVLPLRMSWVNITEVATTLRRGGSFDIGTLQSLLARVGIEALQIDHDIVRVVADARRRFPLNFGDCFAYAHAKLLREPLLTLDADFLATDLETVLHPDRP